jgi:putative tricarboxylic transport membrane protein
MLPVLVVVTVIATYSLGFHIYEPLVMCAFGVIGYVLGCYGYPFPPFILGLVLGPLLEGYFRKMVGEAGSIMPLFTEPIALTFLILAVCFLIYSIKKSRQFSGHVD